MSEIKNYKCPCCSAPLVFGAEQQKLHCNSCNNSFDAETVELVEKAEAQSKNESKYDWEKYEPREYEDVSEFELANYSCPSCGASVSGDSTLGSTVCPYCGNATIIKSQFEGSLQPDYIIPFKVDKSRAMTFFEEACKKAPFLPEEFKNKKKIEEMAGVYVPFWMFDCDCAGAVTYNAERITSWSTSNYRYTKTDHFKLFRAGQMGFENIPVDGSKKADDAYMEALEPFDYKDAVNFNSAYLSGFLADKYDVGVEESVERANERVKNSTVQALGETTKSYVGVIPESVHVEFSNGKIRYSLLPVWMLNVKYMDKMYNFAINGQTGKVVGEFPVDRGKKWKYFASVAGVGYVIAAIIAFLMLS